MKVNKMFNDCELGELEVMLQNLVEEHKKCPFRFHVAVLDDYCNVLAKEKAGIDEDCPLQLYKNSLVDRDVVYPKCNYFQTKLNLDYEIYKRKNVMEEE